MTVREVRDQIDQLMTQHGARLERRGTHRNYVIPTGKRGALQVETRVKSPVTTLIAMERWKCLDAPNDIADPWLEEHIWPATRRLMNRTRNHFGFLPTGGSYSGSMVPTDEAVDLLATWLPMEFEWQRIAAEREGQA